MQIDQAITALQDIGKALHEADKANFGLVIVTGILAISTIIFGYLTLRKTSSQIRRSEERQDLEHFERIRPWIVINGPVPVQVEYENRGTISWEEFRNSSGSDIPPSAVKVGMLFTNTGIRPAKNLKQISLRYTTQITRHQLESEQEQDMYLDFGPNQSQYYLFRIPWDEWRQLIEMPIFIGLRISYDNGRTRSYSGGIYKFARAQWELISSWYDG